MTLMVDLLLINYVHNMYAMYVVLTDISNQPTCSKISFDQLYLQENYTEHVCVDIYRKSDKHLISNLNLTTQFIRAISRIFHHSCNIELI